MHDSWNNSGFYRFLYNSLQSKVSVWEKSTTITSDTIKQNKSLRHDWNGTKRFETFEILVQ